MKKIIVLGFVILLALGMFACFSPELENVNNDGSDIDAVIDEGDNGSNTDSGGTKGNPSGNVVLPSLFEDTSKDDSLQSIDLLVPGATQLIKWDVIENMLYADIYLYKEGNLYKEIVIGIENIGEYEWVSSESLETGHYYEVVVSQYTNQRPDDPYKDGYISAEFSMYPSAVNSAQLFVDTFHECLSEQEKKNYFIAYYKIFAESGVEFMEEVKGKGDSDGGEIIYDDAWINHPIKRWLLEQANEADSV